MYMCGVLVNPEIDPQLKFLNPVIFCFALLMPKALSDFQYKFINLKDVQVDRMDSCKPLTNDGFTTKMQ